MWTIEYIFSQICMALAILMLGITYFLKSKKVILVYSTVGALMFAAHYFLLGSYVGIVLNILAVIRGIWFYCNEAASKKSQVVSFVVIMIANLIIGIFTLKSWLDVLAIVACLLYTFAVWQKSILHYKWSAIIEIICWIV